MKKCIIPYGTVAEMDNLFLIYKIYKQNKKSAVKHAAASFTVDFLFCLYNFVNKNKKSAAKHTAAYFTANFFILFIKPIKKKRNQR